MWCGPSWRHCVQERTSLRNGCGAGRWPETTRARPRRADRHLPRPQWPGCLPIEGATVDADLCEQTRSLEIVVRFGFVLLAVLLPRPARRVHRRLNALSTACSGVIPVGHDIAHNDGIRLINMLAR